MDMREKLERVKAEHDSKFKLKVGVMGEQATQRETTIKDALEMVPQKNNYTFRDLENMVRAMLSARDSIARDIATHKQDKGFKKFFVAKKSTTLESLESYIANHAKTWRNLGVQIGGIKPRKK